MWLGSREKCSVFNVLAASSILLLSAFLISNLEPVSFSPMFPTHSEHTFLDNRDRATNVEVSTEESLSVLGTYICSLARF